MRKMRKKNGFTLIELLAVIVILAIITLMATPIIMNIIDASRGGVYDRQRDMVADAAELYYFSHGDKLIWDGNTSYVELGTLKSTNYLRAKILNPLNNEEIPDETKVLIYKEGEEIKYSLQLYDDDTFKWYQQSMIASVEGSDATLPTEIGEKTTVDLNDLIDQGKVAEYRIPTDLTSRCVGNVEIEKVSEDNYEYNAYVDCLVNASTFASHYVSYGGKYLDTFSEAKQTTDGGYIAVGDSNSELVNENINKGKSDAIITKFSSDGTIEWSNNFGGTNNDYFYSVAQIPDGFVAVGTTSSTDGDLQGIYKGGTLDAIIVKYDNAGNLVSKISYGTSSTTYRELFKKIIYDGNNLVMVGAINLTNKDGDAEGVITDLTSDVAIILKMDRNLNTIWRNFFGGTRFDYFSSIKHTVDNGYIISGYSNSNNYDMEGIGYEGLAKREAILVKYDNAGNLEYKNSFRGSNEDYFYDVVEADDGYITVGTSNSSDLNMQGLSKADNLIFDAIIVKFDKTLTNILWTKTFGGTNVDMFNGLTEVNGDQLIAVGSSKSEDMDMSGMTISTGGYSNAIVVKYDLGGTLLEKKTYGGTNSDVFNSIITTSSGKYIVVGETYSSNGHLQNFNKGHSDGILVSYDDRLNLTKIFREPVVLIDKLKPIESTYGSSINLSYENIYTSNNPEVDLGNWCSDSQNYGLQYNYPYGSCLTPFNTDDIKLLTNIETANGYRLVHAGEYEYSIDIPADNKYNWHRISMNFVNSSSLSISNFKLKFLDGHVASVTDAVTDGYIEPLVVVSNTISRLPVEDTRYFFPTPLNIINTGGTTGSGLSPVLYIYIKPKKSQLNFLVFTANKDTTIDGISVNELRNFDISITATN